MNESEENKETGENEKTKTDQKSEPLSEKDIEYDALSAPRDSMDFYDQIRLRQHALKEE